MKTKPACCDVMKRYREVVVGKSYVAGCSSDLDNTVTADKKAIYISTAFEYVTLQLNFCPNCGTRQVP